MGRPTGPVGRLGWRAEAVETCGPVGELGHVLCWSAVKIKERKNKREVWPKREGERVFHFIK